MSEMFEKGQDAIGEHDEQIDQGVEKGGDVADDKTGGKFGDQVDQGQDFVQEKTGEGDTAEGGGAEGGGEDPA